MGISGWEPAENLDRNSEEGELHVESFEGIVRVTTRDPADGSFPGWGPKIFLVPVREGGR